MMNINYKKNKQQNNLRNYLKIEIVLMLKLKHFLIKRNLFLKITLKKDFTIDSFSDLQAIMINFENQMSKNQSN